MNNERPPHACLASFGLMRMVLDPDQPTPYDVRPEGGTVRFMSPELLMPERFGFAESVPTPEADVYAFGLVIYQVCGQDRSYLPFTYIVQVLTGELPFPGLRTTEITSSVILGVRPPKANNASAIGFSDSLWSLAERCWDGDMKLRPKVAEVVSQLERAAADWDGVMPPHAQVESEGDSMTYCEFEISILS